MQLSSTQSAFIAGTLLGDGCLERNGRYVRLRIDHGIEQDAYVRWKYEQLSGWTTGQPREVTYYHPGHNRTYSNVRFATRSDAVFETFWQSFYPRGTKVVPDDIENMLTPLSLAVWLMDDGYKRNDCNAFRFNTDMFCKSDQERLCQVLDRTFNVRCTLHKKGQYWNIYVPHASVDALIGVVRPYIIPSMIYKITLAP